MNLTLPTPQQPLDPLDRSAALARELIAARHAPNTQKAYAQDIKEFTAWGQKIGLDTLPASVDAVVLFIAALAERGALPSTITRKVAAIRFSHAQAGIPSPTTTEPVRAVVAGLRRVRKHPPRQVDPATIDVIQRMLSTCEESPRGIRDRALIAIGFGAALRRSELAALRLEDVQQTPKGLLIAIPKSKTDPESRGQSVAVLDGPRLQIVNLYNAWRATLDRSFGPVFGLTGRQIANIIKGRTEKAGLDPARFSGHSLRAGFVTSAAQAGADIFRLMDVTRHRSVNTVRSYVRRANVFEDHAGKNFM